MLVPPVFGVWTSATRQLLALALGLRRHALQRRGVVAAQTFVWAVVSGQWQSEASGSIEEMVMQDIGRSRLERFRWSRRGFAPEHDDAEPTAPSSVSGV